VEIASYRTQQKAEECNGNLTSIPISMPPFLRGLEEFGHDVTDIDCFSKMISFYNEKGRMEGMRW